MNTAAYRDAALDTFDRFLVLYKAGDHRAHRLARELERSCMPGWWTWRLESGMRAIESGSWKPEPETLTCRLWRWVLRHLYGMPEA